MIFPRLRVGERLNLLAIVPLIAIVTTTVPLVAIQTDNARQSAAVANRIDAAIRFGRVVRELERERLLSVIYLRFPEGRSTPLVLQSETVRDGISDARTAVGKRLSPTLDDALTTVETLDAVRARVLSKSIADRAVNTEFTRKITAVIDALDLEDDPQERSLRALLRAGEQSNSAAANVLIAAGTPVSADLGTAVSSALAVERTHLAEFARLASPGHLDLHTQAERGPATRRVTELQASFLANPTRFSTFGRVDTRLAQVYGAVDSRFRLRGLVLDKVAGDLFAKARSDAASAKAAAWLFGGIAVTLLITMLALSVAIGRSVSRPLRRLTVAADRVADLASAELVRVADDEMDEQVKPRLAAVDVRTDDEIGDLASAINKVQAFAALLLERQVVARRNVAVMFGNLGRRTQNLVGRQLALIDSLERNEQDAELLQQLYSLDHLSSRLRRHANSLLVLSGHVEQQIGSAPQSIADLVRSALGEIEDFQRVAIRQSDSVNVRPAATSDIVLLMAELLENATAFSAPTTRVDVSATVGPDGCRVLVIDHGFGMSAEQLRQENQRLVRRERLDIAPTDVLGLFVVGRLARRHGINVSLLATPTGGVTAEVLLPPQLLAPSVESDPVTATRPDSEIRPPVPLRRSPPPSAASAEPVAGPAIASLNRRVRGAQLPTTDRSEHESPWGQAGSSEAARAMVEQFESGVRRADHQPSQSLPDIPFSHAGHTTGSLDSPGTGSWFAKPQDHGEAIPPPTGRHTAAEPTPPPGAAGLRRRQRGASLPAAAAPAPLRIGQAESPEAARGVVLDVEDGIERAIREIGGNRHQEGTSS